MSRSKTEVVFHPDDIESFAVAAEQWLASAAPLRAGDSSVDAAWGSGPDSVSLFPEWDQHDPDELVQAAKRWLEGRHQAGLSGITISRDSGGLGLTHGHDSVYEMLESQRTTPPSEIWNIGHHMVLPAIDRFGTDEQRRRFIGPGLRGELIFCQLFSEPEAGSDLASLRTSARRIDDSWLINGQKVWTSVAHVAHYGMLLARTDPDGPKRSGITCFILPLHSPGVDVRPIKQMTGTSAFNEVFFDDVIVADSLRLGDVGAGWTVAKATLSTERVSVPLSGPHASVQRLIELAQHQSVDGEPTIRQALADVVIRKRVTELTMQRAHERLRNHGDAGPFSSMLKLQVTDLLTRMGHTAALILGPRMIADTCEWGTWVWSRHIMESAGLRIGGGTDEIQRNILGEVVLGLPREPQPAEQAAITRASR